MAARTEMQSREFEDFFEAAEPKLRRALVSGFGPELGRDATAEALAFGWKRWQQVGDMANPAGYLYRVGERWAKRQRVRRPPVPESLTQSTSSNYEPGLDAALETLSLRQRQVVVLVGSFEFTHAEAAELLGLRRSSIQNHLERGMRKLRQELGVSL